MANAKDTAKEHALNSLVRLGDMMGDGLHLEPGGEWISREYKRALKASGILPPRDTAGVDAFMQWRTGETSCSTCGGKLVQTRKGSFRAKCTQCGQVWQLGKKRKGKRG